MLKKKGLPPPLLQHMPSSQHSTHTHTHILYPLLTLLSRGNTLPIFFLSIISYMQTGVENKCSPTTPLRTLPKGRPTGRGTLPSHGFLHKCVSSGAPHHPSKCHCGPTFGAAKISTISNVVSPVRMAPNAIQKSNLARILQPLSIYTGTSLDDLSKIRIHVHVLAHFFPFLLFFLPLPIFCHSPATSTEALHLIPVPGLTFTANTERRFEHVSRLLLVNYRYHFRRRRERESSALQPSLSNRKLLYTGKIKTTTPHLPTK